jgi:catechol 2,3-dioxygenase-like lactoylglutathione lyase family enzyme
MLNHIMVGTNDIDRSKQFYDAVLGLLGASEPIRNVAASGHTRLFYTHDGSSFCVSEPINDEPATVANGATVGFKCSSPEQVQACAMHRPAGSASHTYATQTATSSARCTGCRNGYSRPILKRFVCSTQVP